MSASGALSFARELSRRAMDVWTAAKSELPDHPPGPFTAALDRLRAFLPAVIPGATEAIDAGDAPDAAAPMPGAAGSFFVRPLPFLPPQYLPPDANSQADHGRSAILGVRDGLAGQGGDEAPADPAAYLHGRKVGALLATFTRELPPHKLRDLLREVGAVIPVEDAEA